MTEGRRGTYQPTKQTNITNQQYKREKKNNTKLEANTTTKQTEKKFKIWKNKNA